MRMPDSMTMTRKPVNASEGGGDEGACLSEGRGALEVLWGAKGGARIQRGVTEGLVETGTAPGGLPGVGRPAPRSSSC